MAKDSVLEYKDLIGDDGTFEELSENIKGLKAELLDLAKTMKKTFSSLKPDDTAGIGKAEKELKDLEKTQKNLVKTEKAMQKAKKKSIELTNEELIQREKQKLQNRERVQRAKQLAIISKEEKNSIAAIRAQLALTTLQWKKFTKEELENTKEGKKLVKTKLKLTTTLKKLEKQTGDNRRNVGNYTKSLGKLGKVAARIFVGRTIVDGIRRVGGAFVELFNENKKGNKSFEQFGNTVTVLIDKIKGVGLAFLEAVLPFVQAVIRRFQFFSKAISDAAGEGTLLGYVFDGIKTAVVAVINTILDLPFIFAGVKAAVSAIADSVKAQFAIMGLDAEKLKLKLKDAFSPITGADSKAINKRLAEIDQAIRDNNKKIILSAGQLGKAYKDASDEARAEFAEFEKEQDAADAKAAAAAKKRAASGGKTSDSIKEQNALLKEQEALLIAISISEGNRIKAIESLEKKITDAQISNIEDRQQQLEALEEQRFKSEQALREANFKLLEGQIQQQDQDVLLLFGEGSEQVQKFRDEAESDLFELRDLHNQIEIQQLEDHEKNKLNIKKEFADKAVTDEFSGQIEPEQIDEQDALDAAASDARVKRELDAAKKIKEANEQLVEDIRDSAEKVGEIIVELFEKQADLSEKNVNKQEGNLSRARDRAAKGLESNLAFEEQELAKRQLEQQRRQKEAEQAARILTLFNLVSAYAAGGDKNALARGLVDFSLLTALSAGFEEGGYTGDNGTKEVAGVVHGKEFVVTAKDTARFGLAGKTGGEFGEAMGDYFDPQSPIQQNPYSAQKEAFKQDVKTQSNGNNEMVRELKAIKSQLAKQPNVGIEIEKMYENVYAMIKSESKQTVTKISRKFLRSK